MEITSLPHRLSGVIENDVLAPADPRRRGGHAAGPSGTFLNKTGGGNVVPTIF
jgi:hypothetical protein